MPRALHTRAAESAVYIFHSLWLRGCKTVQVGQINQEVHLQEARDTHYPKAYSGAQQLQQLGLVRLWIFVMTPEVVLVTSKS